MKRTARIIVSTFVACALTTSAARAVTLAEYDAAGAAPNPTDQGWSWNNTGNVGVGGAALLLSGAANPAQLFTKTVAGNVFIDPWSLTGNIRMAGNSQEEFGRMIFADDGVSTWHLSLLNTGNDGSDGIYNGGDPNGPVLSNTATKIWAEPVPDKPFDGFHDYALVDADGIGGAAPTLYIDGAAVVPAVSALAEPSRFAKGTVGFGSLNPNESGFFQLTHLVFDGNPNAVPEPATIALAGIALLGLGRLSRHARGQ